MTRKKKEPYVHLVGVQLGQFDTYDLEGSFDTAIKNINERHAAFYAMARATPGWDEETCNLLIKHESRRWEEGYDYNIYMMRPENESEKEVRLEKEGAMRRKQDEWDREQYEKLSKKFGNK